MGVLAIPLAIISGLGQAEASKTETASRRIESRLNAKQTELAATQREADRKGRLADALASQNASAGARNVAAFEGSPLTILNADLEAEKVATQRDKFSAELSSFTSRARGRVAGRVGRANQNLSLIQAGQTFAKASGE